MVRLVSFDIGVRTLSITRLYWDETKNGSGTVPPGWTNLKLEKWEIIDILTDNECKLQDSRHADILKLTKCMIQSLTKRKDLFLNVPVDIVCIEQQPFRQGRSANGSGGGGGGVGSVRNKLLAQAVCSFVFCLYANALVSGVSQTSVASDIVIPQMKFISAKQKLKVQLSDKQFCDPTRPLETKRKQITKTKESKATKTTKTTKTTTLSKSAKSAKLSANREHQDSEQGVKTEHEEEEPEVKLSYAQRKKRAVQMCWQILAWMNLRESDQESDRVALPFFQTKKKDDLADSFLQGVFELQQWVTKQYQKQTKAKVRSKVKVNKVDKVSKVGKVGKVEKVLKIAPLLLKQTQPARPAAPILSSLTGSTNVVGLNFKTASSCSSSSSSSSSISSKPKANVINLIDLPDDSPNDLPNDVVMKNHKECDKKDQDDEKDQGNEYNERNEDAESADESTRLLHSTPKSKSKKRKNIWNYDSTSSTDSDQIPAFKKMKMFLPSIAK